MSGSVKERIFRFKQFSVHHGQSGMHVGTDGVLLGAWTDIQNATSILDIGTGSGLIALMLAQRTHPTVHIDAVEIDPSACTDASRNFEHSPWGNRLTLHCCAIQEFKSNHQYDLIVSNPPYFQNSYKPSNLQREQARHTHHLPFEHILQAANKFLSEKGSLSLILPVVEGKEFISSARSVGYYCTRTWEVRSREKKPVERLLLTFSRMVSNTDEGELILHGHGDEWSDEYKKLTRDFYLKL